MSSLDLFQVGDDANEEPNLSIPYILSNVVLYSKAKKQQRT